MQTFTVKVTGNKLTDKDIREAIWCTTELSNDQILVTEE